MFSKPAAPPEQETERTSWRKAFLGYLGVRISLYCSFSTRVVAATDMGMTMLLMSKELSPRRLLIGCCWGTKSRVYMTKAHWAIPSGSFLNRYRHAAVKP